MKGAGIFRYFCATNTFQLSTSDTVSGCKGVKPPSARFVPLRIDHCLDHTDGQKQGILVLNTDPPFSPFLINVSVKSFHTNVIAGNICIVVVVVVVVVVVFLLPLFPLLLLQNVR